MNITVEIKYDDIEDIIEKAVICFEDGVKVLENILEEVKIVKLHSDLRILTQLQSGGCMEIVWRVSGGCLEGVLRVSGGHLKGVWRVSKGCPNGMLGV